MITDIPIVLRGEKEILTVEYERNISPVISGFDVLDVPFAKERCIGYPTVHAYFKNMKLTGYKRYCGFIQVIERVEDGKDKKVSVDTDHDFHEIGNPYFSYGYPASLYDAPCMNLGTCSELIWKAYTYLVDMPTRMNGNKLKFIAGFSWGYTENIDGIQSLLDFELLTESHFVHHGELLCKSGFCHLNTL